MDGKPALGAVLQHGAPIDVSAERIVLAIPPNSFFGKQAETRDAQRTRADTAERVLGALPRVYVTYREQAGLTGADISVAVVVQALIESEHAGIAFSAHPVTGDTTQVVVEAVHGLGEAAVGGYVTPHTYVLAKKSGDIIEIYEGTQDKMLVRGTHNESQWQPLPANARKLSSAELRELVGHVSRIEAHFGKPMDVEWARAHNIFYIVQSRPITTL
jgi:pyruvate,water dikinase